MVNLFQKNLALMVSKCPKLQKQNLKTIVSSPHGLLNFSPQNFKIVIFKKTLWSPLFLWMASLGDSWQYFSNNIVRLAISVKIRALAFSTEQHETFKLRDHETMVS